MKSSREQNSVQKSPLKENEAEGRGGHESRPATGTDEPAGQKDGASDRHAAPNSLQESEPQTQPSLIPPCPPSPAETDHVNPITVKRHFLFSTPPEDGPTSAKRRNDGPESAERNEKEAPSPDVWKFTIIKIDMNNNIVDYVDLKNILFFLEDNYLNTLQKIFSRNDENSIFVNVKNKFLQMLDKKTAEYINKYENRQHAFVFFKRKGVSKSEFMIEIKGPYVPRCRGKVHSEDFIIEEIEPLINDDVSEIWIYTLNNPCLGRKNHRPCMYNLIKFSERYPDLKMYIGFSKYYIFISKINRFCEQAGKQITFDSRFCFTSKNLDSDSVETCKVQNEKGAETSAELLSTPREKIKERNENIAGIKSENDERVGLRLGEELNRYVVLTFLNNFQGRYSNLKFFHLPFNQCLNSANSDNSANLANEE
ncbi:uncharacterized protein LOC124388721 [Silurus meridionalis]|uniref:uncharacterized protein LOC124388721 n=1 Tax=Silurus meridionalis TaxID=175797 RepID=UPI001EEA9CA9|nr:uncharacterized protein LOC124388721 [Silurus meridionalis]